MRSIIAILLISLLASCTEYEGGFTDEDKKEVNQIRRDYVNGWLANDKETVLGLFKDDATIVPSGLFPISGMEEIELYWFPNDSSMTTIHSYEIELLDLQGTDSIAYSLEKGILNFTYAKGDFTMTKESTSHATTIYQKNLEGNWKIISRMWTSLNQ